MKTKIMALTIAVVLSCSNYALASEMYEHGKHDGVAVKVDNMICPVSGQNIEAMGGGIEHEYKGKIYNLCCLSCVEAFKKDPEKYIEILERGIEEKHEGSYHVY